MESDVLDSQGFYQLWAWFEKNKKQVIYGLVAALAVGLVIWFVLWRKAQTREAAAYALSELTVAQVASGEPKQTSADEFLKVASQYPNTPAGAQAVLRAAGAYFEEGKYAEAHTQFQRFQREYGESSFRTQALLGIAASLEAQGKGAEALEAYRTLVERHPTDSVINQARFALARLYDAQGKPEQAKNHYEELAKADPYGMIGSEAGMKLEELLSKHPNLAAPKPLPVGAAPPITITPVTNLATPAATATNAPSVK